MDGWRIDVGYPEDREEAERRLTATDDGPEPDDNASAETGSQ
jgi:glucose-1-phosphate thymidylyltransferase